MYARKKVRLVVAPTCALRNGSGSICSPALLIMFDSAYDSVAANAMASAFSSLNSFAPLARIIPMVTAVAPSMIMMVGFSANISVESITVNTGLLPIIALDLATPILFMDAKYSSLPIPSENSPPIANSITAIAFNVSVLVIVNIVNIIVWVRML